MLPSHEGLMLPMLKILSDKKLHNLNEVADKLATVFKVSDEERKKLLPSGKYPVFRNRVGWARTYMSKAGLIEVPQRANYKITDLGLKLLEENLDKIDKSLLLRYDSFKEFITPNQKGNTSKGKPQSQLDSATPLENIENNFQELYNHLSKELMQEIMGQDFNFFETLVVELLVKMGYGGSLKDAGEAIGKSGDGGIDGKIKEDRLGLDVIYIQAKRYKDTVPISHIRDFLGALVGKRARKGVFITISGFPKSATKFVSGLDHKIILIDGKQLTDLMIEYNLGVEFQNTYEVKSINFDYFNRD